MLSTALKVASWVSGNWYMVLLAAIASVIAMQSWQVVSLKAQLADEKREVRAIGLRADSLNAELDTTRLVANQYRRLAVQTEIDRDSLATALKERPVVTTTVTIISEPVVDTVFAELVEDGSALHSRLDSETLIAEVSIKLFPPHVATWKVEVLPVRAIVGVRCGPVSATTGVRPVQVTVEAELWEVEISESKVSPEVCNPDAPPERKGGFWRGVLGGAISVLALTKLIGG